MSKVIEFKRKDDQPYINEPEPVTILSGIEAIKDAIVKLSELESKNVYIIKDTLEMVLASVPLDWFKDLDFFFGIVDNDLDIWEADFISYVEARYFFNTDCITVTPFLNIASLETEEAPEECELPKFNIKDLDEYFTNLIKHYPTEGWGYFKFIHLVASYLVNTFDCSVLKLNSWQLAISFENNDQLVIATFDFTSMFRDLSTY